jgi:hypothetical protein
MERATVVLCLALTSSSHAQDEDQQQKSDKMLYRFPSADMNRDGKLTVEQAKAHLEANPALLKK